MTAATNFLALKAMREWLKCRLTWFQKVCAWASPFVHFNPCDVAQRAHATSVSTRIITVGFQWGANLG